MRFRIYLVIIIALSVLLSACVPLNPVPSGLPNEQMIQTAIAQTQAAEQAKEAGEALYGTASPGVTQEVTLTPEATSTPEIQPTSENPWMLQAWCEDHADGCAIYDVNNKTDSWLQVTLQNTETGDTGFFTIKSKTVGKITLIPGQYQANFTWWCEGNIRSMTEIMAIGLWKDFFKCPQGHYKRVKK